MKNFSSQSWQIEHQCPQCGAPVVLEETDRILACAFCRVRLFLACESHFRYLLPPSPTCPVPPEEMMFVPYWRFKGAVHSFHIGGMEHRMVDSSMPAVKLKCLPPSLGYRPQVLKLRFVTPRTAGCFLAPQFPFKMPAQAAAKVRDDLPGGSGVPAILFETFLGETLSIIYAPVYIRSGSFYDAILNRPIGQIPTEGVSCLPPARGQDMLISFFSTLCPACGWDLEGDKDTLVLHCRNCTSSWESSAGGLKRIAFATVAGDEESVHYLPFWQIRAEVSGSVSLKSYADLIRTANLPKAVRSEWSERELSFWIPAFKVQPHLFLRLARSVTVLQPSEEPTETLPLKEAYPVTLPLSEALESIPAAVASFAVPRNQVLPRIPNTRVEYGKPLLVYLPFARQGEELIHRGMQLSISRNALRLGKLL